MSLPATRFNLRNMAVLLGVVVLLTFGAGFDRSNQGISGDRPRNSDQHFCLDQSRVQSSDASKLALIVENNHFPSSEHSSLFAVEDHQPSLVSTIDANPVPLRAVDHRLPISSALAKLEFFQSGDARNDGSFEPSDASALPKEICACSAFQATEASPLSSFIDWGCISLSEERHRGESSGIELVSEEWIEALPIEEIPAPIERELDMNPREESVELFLQKGAVLPISKLSVGELVVEQHGWLDPSQEACVIFKSNAGREFMMGLRDGSATLVVTTRNLSNRKIVKTFNYLVTVVSASSSFATQNFAGVKALQNSIGIAYPSSSISIDPGEIGLIVSGSCPSEAAAGRIIRLVRKVFTCPVDDRIAVLMEASGMISNLESSQIDCPFELYQTP